MTAEVEASYFTLRSRLLRENVVHRTVEIQDVMALIAAVDEWQKAATDG